jgi:hypothetical protein
MIDLRLGSTSAVLLLALSLTACLGTPLARDRGPVEVRAMHSTRYFDAARIRQSAAATAWDAVDRLAPHVRLVEAPPWGIRRDLTTNGSGLSGAPAARLMINGFAVADPTVLRAIAASSVIDIEILGASEATMRLGTGYGGGAVLVRTVNRAGG